MFMVKSLSCSFRKKQFTSTFCVVSDIAVFVLKRDVKLQPTNIYLLSYCKYRELKSSYLVQCGSLPTDL